MEEILQMFRRDWSFMLMKLWGNLPLGKPNSPNLALVVNGEIPKWHDLATLVSFLPTMHHEPCRQAHLVPGTPVP